MALDTDIVAAASTPSGEVDSDDRQIHRTSKGNAGTQVIFNSVTRHAAQALTSLTNDSEKVARKWPNRLFLTKSPDSCEVRTH